MTRARVRSLPPSRWIAVVVTVVVAMALVFVAAYREEAARDRIHAVLIDDTAAQNAWSTSLATQYGHR